MKKQTLIIVLCLLSFRLSAQVTLDECQQAAMKNYPLIKRYDMISKTADVTVANINKGWLPQITAQMQATLQNEVSKLPDGLTSMMSQQGYSTGGMAKDHYQIGVNIQQTIYDGGRIKNQKNIARLQENVQQAQNDVNIYTVCKRVNEIYFSVLLIKDKIKLNADIQNLLIVNEKKLSTMVKDGVAAESDFNAVEAERLAAVQQALELDSEKASLLRLLSMFTGKTVSEVVKPNEVETGASVNRRPELRMIENQIKLTEVQEKALNVGLMPRLTAFAQGYYGYPGYDMFQGMRSRDWSLNGMVGVTLSWDIGALYTRKNDKSKFILQRQMSENQRDEFLFNISLEQVQQDDNIECYRQLLKTDDDIVLLRQKVRKASESKLEHGIIDVNDLVKEINNENQALVQKSTHEIQLLQSVYDKKYINND